MKPNNPKEKTLLCRVQMKLLVLLAFILLGTMISCKTSTTDTAAGWSADNLTDGYTKLWKQTAYFIHGTRFEIPVWAADNLYIFNKDGTGCLWYGEIDRYGADTLKIDDITWQLDGKLLTFKDLNASEDTDASGKRVMTVLELSKDILRYEYHNNNAAIVEVWYVPVLYPSPNPSPKNKMLTHGNAKFWKIQQVWRDGEPYTIPQWRKDDLLLFCTDGTGYYTTGTTSQYIKDTTNNDFFYWGFAENETKIDIEKFEHGYMNVSDCDIIELSDSVFTYQGTLYLDGKSSLWKMKRVPLLK